MAPTGNRLKTIWGRRGEKNTLAASAALEGYKRIREQARNLRKLGFESVEHDAALVIAELSNAGVFSGGGILIGTRAFGSILNHLGYKATPFLSTQDVDIARIRTLKLTTSLPDGGFGELLKRTGLRFSPVMGLERPPGPPTSFKVIGRDLKIDLLVPAPTSAMPFTIKRIPELGAHAKMLPFLDYLISDSWSTVIIGRDHLIPVRCPPPARYCFHKLVVADMRSGLKNPKKDKDTAQAGILAAILHEEDPESLVEAANAMTSTMVNHAKKSLPQLEKLLAGHYPAALDRVQGLLFGSP